MTAAEFLSLPARERDALVAEHVIGLTVKRTLDGLDTSRYRVEGKGGDLVSSDMGWYDQAVPKYSTKISRAWHVVEKDETLFKLQYDYISDMWDARFGAHQFQAETAPLAICLAALEKVGFLHG